MDTESSSSMKDDTADSKRRSSLLTKFPKLLHDMLDDAEERGFSDVVRWLPCGKRFRIISPERLVPVLAQYFQQTKWKSFLRQLQNYGFTRERNVCSHPFFVRGQRHLVEQMRRQKGDELRQAKRVAKDKLTPSFLRGPDAGDFSANSATAPTQKTSPIHASSPMSLHANFASQAALLSTGFLPRVAGGQVPNVTPNSLATAAIDEAAKRRFSVSGFLKSQRNQATSSQQKELEKMLFWQQQQQQRQQTLHQHLQAAQKEAALRLLAGSQSLPPSTAQWLQSANFNESLALTRQNILSSVLGGRGAPTSSALNGLNLPALLMNQGSSLAIPAGNSLISHKLEGLEAFLKSRQAGGLGVSSQPTDSRSAKGTTSELAV